ncbi:ABC transporter substrate-binding protein [Corynebacterium heidelbergense]|uniref:ABC transporter substrate-binding protein n=1 Tax=Corynebacterium heidelbergense TaxID=2055947 RepID=A0A364VDS4_9CORY|nr:ABC transporter substrate-binding protein [Corynebacterium heidelbergense]RAV34812.1 ABC transporter substrate-binding protein [Corynebacterium heidelbergense]WCZ37213.1 putative ABC transporter-binding protein precursor [Corynebacterium heidelbergense]
MAPTQRKIVAALAASTLAASALGLSACSEDSDGGGDTGSNTAKGPITFAMGKNDTDKIRPIIDKWNAAHPEEKVNLRELAGEADAQRDTLVQSLQAGSSDIDVMALDVVWTAQFAANGWLAPLKGDLQVDTSKMLKAPVKSATYKNTLYALPQNTNGQLLFRNTEQVPQAPQKWDDLKNACKAVKGRDCLTTQLSQYEGLTVATAEFMNGWGGGITDESGKITVTSQDSRAGLQALVDAYEDHTIASSSTGATEEETNLSFTQGQTAMAINWPYMYANAQKDGSAVKGKVEVSPILGKDGVGVSTLGGYNNGINIKSKHKGTAKAFMEFIVNEDNQRSFAESAFPPVLASIYDDPAVQEKQPYMAALKASLENAKPRPASPNYDALSKAVQDNAYAALTQGRPVDTATSDMEKAIRATNG